MIRIRYCELKGLIISRFGSLTIFASSLGWTKQRLSKVLNGDQILKARELEQMAQALEMPMDTLIKYFPRGAV